MHRLENSAHKPIIVAHRGASGKAPENTYAAVSLAHSFGAQWCEIDVQQTADNQLVVIHDVNTIRTTGVFKWVSRNTYSELSELDAGGWFLSKWKNEPIPLLKELLHSAPKQAKFNIEIKAYKRKPELFKELLTVLDDEHFAKRCIITSFNHKLIDEFSSITHLRTGYIVEGRWSNRLLKTDVPIISIDKALINKSLAEEIHKVGKELHIWTVNNKRQFSRITRYKPHAIITNYPEKIKNYLNPGELL